MLFNIGKYTLFSLGLSGTRFQKLPSPFFPNSGVEPLPSAATSYLEHADDSVSEEDPDILQDLFCS